MILGDSGPENIVKENTLLYGPRTISFGEFVAWGCSNSYIKNVQNIPTKVALPSFENSGMEQYIVNYQLTAYIVNNGFHTESFNFSIVLQQSAQ